MNASQLVQVQRHLAQGKSITPLEALKRFGCLRLGARVWDLRRRGFDVRSKLVPVGVGKHVAEYFIPRARRCARSRK